MVRSGCARQVPETYGGKGGIRTLDPSIVSAGLGTQVSDFCYVKSRSVTCGIRLGVDTCALGLRRFPLNELAPPRGCTREANGASQAPQLTLSSPSTCSIPVAQEQRSGHWIRPLLRIAVAATPSNGWSTTIQVPRLFRPEFLVEVEPVAVIQ